MSKKSKKFRRVAKENPDRERSVDFTWGDGSRSGGRFGFKFGDLGSRTKARSGRSLTAQDVWNPGYAKKVRPVPASLKDKRMRRDLG